MNIKNLKKLGRDSIIKLAINEIYKTNHVSIISTYFNKILVQANNDELYVNFYNNIKYLEPNTLCFTDFMVHFVNGNSTPSTNVNYSTDITTKYSNNKYRYAQFELDSTSIIPVYTNNSVLIQKTENVLKLMNECGNKKVTNYRDLGDMRLTIVELANSYVIEEITDSSEHTFEIDKISKTSRNIKIKRNEVIYSIEKEPNLNWQKTDENKFTEID